jgi:transcriptional regulator with XRE-family HTH domain
MFTAEQIRAARAMLRIEQRELARRAGVSLETVKRIERSRGPVSTLAATAEALRGALEQAGVIFIAEDSEGPGVRLRKRIKSTTPASQPASSNGRSRYPTARRQEPDSA